MNMAFKVNRLTNLTQQIIKFWGSPVVDNFNLQFVRYQSIVAQKLIYSEYGDASKVVRKESQKLPAPKANEIVVRMLAAPVNPADINTIQGVYPIKPSLPSIPGNEGVGEVICVGSDVTEFQEGDKVIPSRSAWGTWRTHAVCKAEDMIKVPSSIGIVEAATITVNPCTAYRMLRDFVELSKGDTVIQNGANSACGQNVIQMCKAGGITSVNIVRDRKNINELKDTLMSLGASHVLTEEELRSTQLFKGSQVPKPKLALNCVGGKNALNCLRQLQKGGTMVTYGGMSREPVTVPTSTLIFKDIIVRGFWMTQWSIDNAGTEEQKEMMEDIYNLYEEGLLQPPVHKCVPFDNYHEALENTINPKGFTGVKYIIEFKNESET